MRTLNTHKRSVGYNLIMAEVRGVGEILSDPYDVGTQWMYAIGDTAWIGYGVTLPGFIRAPQMKRLRFDTLEGPYARSLVRMFQRGFVDEDDFRHAYAVVRRYVALVRHLNNG